MKHPILNPQLSCLSEFIGARMGLHFPPERWGDLERGIISAARDFGFKDVESCIEWLVSSPLGKSQIEILASHLTVGETYFFRQSRSFEILQEHILPELIRSRRGAERRLRIWSAGCATGEEPYSVAIALSRTVPDSDGWEVSVLATDINPRFLQKASQDVYGGWSFRETPEWVKERYFRKKEEGHYEILSQIRKMVRFSYLNLAEDVYPSLLNNTNAMDIVFFRNVLMYFTPERARQVIQNLYRCLVDGGWLIVSPSETSHVLYAQFATVNFPGLILNRKDPQRAHAGEGSPRLVFEGPIVSFRPPLPSVTEPEPATKLVQEGREPVPAEVTQGPGAESPVSAFEDALTLYKQGHYAEAAETILGNFSDNGNDARMVTLLARVYANQGRLADALGWCEKAISADKMNAGSHYLRATILQEQGCLEEATVSLKRTLYLDPSFVLGHFALGNLALQEGKIVESEKHFANVQSLLSAYRQEEILPESEGVTAGRLKQIITAYRDQREGGGR